MLQRFNLLLFHYNAPVKKITAGHTPAFTKKMHWLFLFFAQLVYLLAFSQKQNIKFEHLGTMAGLSESNVLCILQDSRGFMWFGTKSGLNKYDGYTFTVYKNDRKNPASISNNFIQDITESRNGDLWIATLGGGICRYDRRKDQFTRFQFDANIPVSISNDDINSVLEDSKGQVWAGTSDGLDRFDPSTNKFIHYRYNTKDSTSISDNYIRTIFEDSRQDIWIGTLKGGLNRFNRQSGTFTRFQHLPENNRSISSNNVFTIFEDSKRRLWIGMDNDGLDLFSRESGQFFNFKHKVSAGNSLANNAVRAIEETNENILWIGTENGGISIFNPEKNEFHTYENDELDNTSLASNSINTIYKDPKGNMWIGTFNAGADQVNIDAGKFAHYKNKLLKNSLSHNKVLCIYEDSKKKIWIGTDGGGLNLFDPETGHFTYFRHEKNNKKSICGDYVLSVCEDSKGNIWVGTWGDGVTVFNRAGNSFRHFKNDPQNPFSLSSNNAWKIIEDREKNIWIGTYGGGLNLFNPAAGSFTNYQYDEKDEHGIGDSWINSMYEDSDGGFWIATAGGGLNLFNRKSKTFTRFQPHNTANSISNNNITSVCEDRNKNLWISTASGLSFLDKKTGRFTIYTTDDGLPGNLVFGILEDRNGNLWISTDKGISCFNPVSKVFKNFGVADGLQSNEFKEQAYCKSSSGAMYFGGNNGFNQFFPGNIKTLAFEPPLVITGFAVFNKKVLIAKNNDDPSPLKQDITETKAITLPYRNSVFSFDFASLNYTTSENKQYAYMLEGFDKAWNEVGTQRTATYTNLDPGNYIFKVKGSDNEGNWSSKTAGIHLTITPPFWLTWWFKLSAIASIAGCTVAFFRFRINRINAQKAKLQQQVQEKTMQLVKSNEDEQKARLEADKANIELEQKNIEMEQFVYIASHDLREPLRTTSGFVEMLQKQYKGKLDERANNYLSYISQASDRMKTLINDLLDYSRIDTKKEMQQVDCNTILREVLTDLGVALSEARAEIKADRLPVINAYPTGIKQLFQNLITNGIKFRKKDAIPEIQISSEIKGDSWKFSFTDNGIGIEQKHSEKIFVIFQRLHNRKEYEGSGIGLSHCKKIVELHKGKIWVESIPGTGSTFHFTLPNDSKT